MIRRYSKNATRSWLSNNLLKDNNKYRTKLKINILRIQIVFKMIKKTIWLRMK
jgi:hypothetical protein